MKTIINNFGNLKESEIEKNTKKVRAIIVNNNKLVLINYADVIMLPGGKIDGCEKKLEALRREIKEELGIEYITEIDELVTIKNYMRNYPIRKSNLMTNRLTETTYYVIKTDDEINIENSLLTSDELSNNFSYLKVDLKDVDNFIKSYNSYNERNKYFKNELLQVMDEYKKYCLENNQKKLIDLHTHSFYSDGELNPIDLVNLAKKNNIGTISITDHDTLEGNKLLFDHINELGNIKIIPGIELSAKVTTGRMHILGYNIDIYNKDLNKKMEELKNNSLNSVLSIIEQIKRDYGIIFTFQEIKDLINSNHNLNRVDITKLCVKNGYAKNIKEAFSKYLVDAYNKVRANNKGLSYYECIDLILKSGGIPVLAHPTTLNKNKIELLNLIKEMTNNGLKGIEVYHSSHNKKETSYYLYLANKFGLLVSGGSDFHGKSVKPDIEIGTGKDNNIKIKRLSILEK